MHFPHKQKLTSLLKFFLWCFLLSALYKTSFAETKNKEVNIYFFYGDGCPHCAKEERFFNKLIDEYPDVKIHFFEVWGNKENANLLKTIGSMLNARINGVPFTVIGENYIIGFQNENTTGEQIKDYINLCLSAQCKDLGKFIDLTKSDKIIKGEKKAPPQDTYTNVPKHISAPLLGKIDLTKLSLPAIAAVIGTLDGFNPCAMWVLLFLISLLINEPNKSRRWVLGLAFILASGLVYFLFMSAWLNILLFVGFISIVRNGVGLFAISAGIINVKNYIKGKSGCEAPQKQKRKIVFEKLKLYAQNKSLIASLIGIVGLAFAVNLIELFCSAGFPAIFTQILTLNKLTTIQYYFYIIIYIIFFMLDDLIVFTAAMKALEIKAISTKYTKYSNLIGGILMIAIGALLIIKPQYLYFNF